MSTDGLTWQLIKSAIGPLILILDIATGHYGWALVIAALLLVWILLTVADLWLTAEKARLDLQLNRRDR